MEVFKLRKICLLMISIFAILLTSCGDDTTQLAKDEFSKYDSGKDEVVLLHNNVIYTGKQELDLATLVKDEEPNNGVLIKEDKILFSTSVQKSKFDYTLNIYEVEMQGAEVQLFFQRMGLKHTLGRMQLMIIFILSIILKML